jgi:hypothetical protein
MRGRSAVVSSPVAQVTERGEVSLTNDDATGYEVTVTGYPDTSTV